jgi:ParB family transcriptional regulator, chromosome partitioning protein
LPDEIQASLAKGEISAGHARALLSIDDPAEQRRVWQQVVLTALSVRDAEGLARQQKRPPAKLAAPRRLQADLAAIQEKLQFSLGTKVDLKKGRKGGRLTIHFFSDEEFDFLVDRLTTS